MINYILIFFIILIFIIIIFYNIENFKLCNDDDPISNRGWCKESIGKWNRNSIDIDIIEQKCKNLGDECDGYIILNGDTKYNGWNKLCKKTWIGDDIPNTGAKTYDPYIKKCKGIKLCNSSKGTYRIDDLCSNDETICPFNTAKLNDNKGICLPCSDFRPQVCNDNKTLIGCDPKTAFPICKDINTKNVKNIDDWQILNKNFIINNKNCFNNFELYQNTQCQLIDNHLEISYDKAFSNKYFQDKCSNNDQCIGWYMSKNKKIGGLCKKNSIIKNFDNGNTFRCSINNPITTSPPTTSTPTTSISITTPPPTTSIPITTPSPISISPSLNLNNKNCNGIENKKNLYCLNGTKKTPIKNIDINKANTICNNDSKCGGWFAVDDNYWFCSLNDTWEKWNGSYGHKCYIK